ncbi:MAG: methyltransferase [bacterium]|nr:methyltransferase [bacterium]
MRMIYEAICEGRDIRANLIVLKNCCKEEASVKELYALQPDWKFLSSFLSDPDAKVRKNVALLLGETNAPNAAADLMNAYRTEETRFVKPAYVQALSMVSVEDYLDELQEDYNRLLAMTPEADEAKHVNEMKQALAKLLGKNDMLEHHVFRTDGKKHDLILTAEKAYRDVLLKQVKACCDSDDQMVVHPLGVKVRTAQIDKITKRVRMYREALFALKIKERLSGNETTMAKKLIATDFLKLLEDLHTTADPFYFRIECKSGMTLEEKSAFTKRLAAAIETESAGKLRNSTGDYEVELRLVQTADGSFFPCVKLHTMIDHRFAYRKVQTAASMHPSTAAAIVALLTPYLSQDANVLDAMCGVGTLLIERCKAMNCMGRYGVDIYGEAIAGANENAKAAGIACNFITKDFLTFTIRHEMHEVFADMPRRGKKSKEELDELYRGFFDKASEVMAHHGFLFIYCDEEGFVKKNLRLHTELALKKEFEITKKHGINLYVIEKK